MPEKAERAQMKERGPIAKRPQMPDARSKLESEQIQGRVGALVSGPIGSSISKSVANKPRVTGNQSRLPRLQTKLTTGPMNDPLEREADAAADRMMQMTDPHIPHAAPPSQNNATPKGAIAVAPASVHEALASPGRPLDDTTRAFFEPRFEQDFSDVRVHVDGGSAESARSIHARAYTSGHHIVFASNAYAPDTSDGRRLIAHELTHVVQQSAASGPEPAAIQRNADEDLTNDWVRDLNEHVATHRSPYKHIVEIISFARRYDLDDNVAADFAASQPLAQLENFGSTAEGRDMLDVLYKAMMTGSVSDYERVQAARFSSQNGSHVRRNYIRLWNFEILKFRRLPWMGLSSKA